MLSSWQPRILVLDDDENVIDLLHRQLANTFAFCSIETFTSSAQALERARSQPFDVVLTEYCMPEMNGASFLKMLCQLQSECVCIVMSGHADMTALVSLINETPIFRYLAKPWTSAELCAAMTQALILRGARVQASPSPLSTSTPVSDSRSSEQQVLVVSENVAEGKAIMDCLGQHSKLDDLFAERVAGVDTASIFEQLRHASPRIIGSESIDLLFSQHEKFACLVANLTMHSEDQLAFFRRFAEAQPHCPVILISSHSSIQTIVSEIPNLFSFVIKPWRSFDLRCAVGQALCTGVASPAGPRKETLLAKDVCVESLSTPSDKANPNYAW